MSDGYTIERVTPALSVPINADQVHKSRKDAALDAAVTAFIQPFLTSMRSLHLASNVWPSPSLSGYVAVVGAEAPVAPFLEDGRMGTGTSWFRLQPVDQAKLASGFSTKEVPGFSLARLLPEGRVSVVEGKLPSEYPDSAFFLVVHGNDQDSARALRKAVSPATTVRDVVKTDASLKGLYSNVFKASRERRAEVALKFAAAHGLSIDNRHQAGDFDTHIIVPSAAESGARNAEGFLVYNNVADTTETAAGLMVYRGPLAGYQFHAGPKHTVHTKVSHGWDNATASRKFSMFPADTGRFLDDGRTPDRHANSNPAIRTAAKMRLRWVGPVKSYNPLAEEIYHAPTDAGFLGVSTSLGAAPGGPVSSIPFDTIVTELPALDTRNHSIDALVQVLEKSGEPALPVSLGNPVILSLVQRWPALKQTLGAKTLASLLQDERDDHLLLADAAIRALAK